MNNPFEKGNALENAVRAVESVILRASPAYRENTFVIHSKKIEVVDGVSHEIDILVEIDIGKGYKSIFIFECKNWEDKVGKNEVIIFAAKIAAIGAQRGFFIAKSFTRDARAQAAKDPRVTLLLAREYPAEKTPVPLDFHFLGQERTDAEVLFNERGESSSRRTDVIDISSAQSKLGGQELGLDKY